MSRIYRVTGTGAHNIAMEVASPNEHTARRSAEDGNRNNAKAGRPQDWRAEYADIEWKALP